MKKMLYFVCVFVIAYTLLCSCKKNDSIDYSEYSFVNVSWTRETEYDTETISFDSNGHFSYSCGCGNPVNNADICETYSYNAETKEIKLECEDPSKNTITTIKIINSDENSLELDFNGEIRSFKKIEE